ncbi:MAG: formylglycine-generating enzyme family protein, partial [Bryobacteraceae bacterium]
MQRIVLTLAMTGLLLAQDVKWKPQGSQIPGPENPAEFSQWIASLRQWRHERLIRMGYDGAEYARPELKWTQSSFIQPQMMCEDRYFYDPAAGRYTVDRYLNDLDKRYGGIDSVLIWPVYPNIGIDNRNQWDLHRDLPGGVEGLRKMIEQF